MPLGANREKSYLKGFYSGAATGSLRVARGWLEDRLRSEEALSRYPLLAAGSECCAQSNGVDGRAAYEPEHLPLVRSRSGLWLRRALTKGYNQEVLGHPSKKLSRFA